MIRFLVGFAVGAAALAMLQIVYAPLPMRTNDGDKRTIDRPVDDLPPTTAPSLAPRPEETVENAPEGSARSNAGPGLPQTGQAAANADNEADESARESVVAIELPPTHAGFVDKSRPSLPDEHAALEAESKDPGWSDLVEELIYEHITQHPKGASIGIVSLVCRTSKCEIVGTVYGERGGEVWRDVMADMRQKAWFANNFSDSALGADGGMPGEHRFLTLLPRVGTDIAPPIDP